MRQVSCELSYIRILATVYVQTMDPSVDGRKSAASRTAIYGRGAYRLAATGRQLVCVNDTLSFFSFFLFAILGRIARMHRGGLLGQTDCRGLVVCECLSVCVCWAHARQTYYYCFYQRNTFLSSIVMFVISVLY